jgi:tRNA nucleotidyltransferase (CCA-adding enzyme)
MFGNLAHKFYHVGGSVRDELLGLAPKDFDYVVEATEEEFLQHFPNAEKVGNSFPVYLIEKNEVALTRTEKNSGNGYADFEVTGVGVSIEADLGRRDFSINSIAKNVVTGEIVDPFYGQHDIKIR